MPEEGPRPRLDPQAEGRVHLSIIDRITIKHA